ncbi:hypothetical protein [Succinivibrio dextrinosolvens]|uniref:Uncharacterized protein n=1 Tax=Succinivibrio dextrinosolvens TaxID=83771 RepID=A0A662ZDI9_9GAMM|nr:hypothetical protein [Succinivibrio dextrinosolvens]SFK59719.1 hypothetical protein SAMN04487865_11322 [Succinivibrio dextrinosolvens]
MCCDRFNTSSEESLPGKCFVEFIAQSLHMRIEYLLRKMNEMFKFANKFLEELPSKAFRPQNYFKKNTRKSA